MNGIWTSQRSLGSLFYFLGGQTVFLPANISLSSRCAARTKMLLLCVQVFGLYALLCTMYVPDTWGDQKQTLHPLGLELQAAVSFHVGYRNQTRVLWKWAVSPAQFSIFFHHACLQIALGYQNNLMRCSYYYYHPFVLMGQSGSDFIKILLATSEAPFCSSLPGRPAFTAFKQSL